MIRYVGITVYEYNRICYETGVKVSVGFSEYSILKYIFSWVADFLLIREDVISRMCWFSLSVRKPTLSKFVTQCNEDVNSRIRATNNHHEN